MSASESPKSMRTFLIIWIGQLISVIGSGLTGFGLSVWMYERTGDATPIALTALFYNLPRVLLSPIAGAVADRYNRRMVLILADTGSALMTALMAGLLFSGRLEIWHLYLTAGLSAGFSAFQEPAYAASITMLVPKKDLVRAGGLRQIGGAAQAILTPVLAGVLYVALDLRGVILIDFATFFFAIGALIFVRIPQPLRSDSDEPGEKKTGMLQDALFGWRYLQARPGLLGLLGYYAAVNFFLSLSGVLTAPLVLSFGSPAEMGFVQMVGGLAMLAGGLLMGTWGGPKGRYIPGVIAAIAMNSFGYLLFGLRPLTAVAAAASFIVMFFIPISASLSQAVWQKKVAPNIQGRVFAIRAMIAYSIIPISNLAAGPLADRVFEPMMAADGLLGQSFIGDLIGVGPGRGIALIYILSAVFLWGFSLAAYLNPRIRNLEADIPDAVPDDPVQPAAQSAAQPA